ncbi:acyl-CoA reductase [Flavobacterium sp. I3-2]|uniref:acyl-CoA reductase n=1 Tax=Flavobacterium sp. I3-2 TaxID=2748319 RepID=UPI0015AEE74C|nr:acyl-CoA reductase [Flavobacterium sp. I3-2]
MILEQKKNAFVALGDFIRQFATEDFEYNNDVLKNEEFFSNFAMIIEQAQNHNGWFTKDQVVFALNSWSNALTQTNLNQWLSNYNLNVEPLKTVGLILAGNIPMVGFHDVISVLISGNKALIKTSSNDQLIIPFLLKYLVAVEPEFESRIGFTKQGFENFDAVIATGSNNTARYFEYYFGKVPNIIRKNRNSVAVLTGNESKEELQALGRDIFTFYGLGCRSISKLFVPTDYNFTAFFEAMYEYSEVIKYERYANNYDYNKAVYLMSNFKILDNGFLTIREDTSYASPISSVFYEFYDNENQLMKKLENDHEKIQCVVSNLPIENKIAFGETQNPQLWDYADGIDTMKFLLSL